MNYKALAEKALEERSALLGQFDELRNGEQTEETPAQLEELRTKMDALEAKAEGYVADAEAEARSAALRAKVAGIQVATRSTSNKDADELRGVLKGGFGSGATFGLESRAVLGSPTSNYGDATFGQKVLQVVGNRSKLVQAGAVAQVDGSGNQIAAIAVDNLETALTPRGSALPDTTVGADVKLGAYLIGGIVRIDKQLIDDAAWDLVGAVANKGGAKLATDLNAYLVGGTGTNQPLGVVGTGSLATKGADAPAASITEAAILKLNARVPNATAWIMHTSTFGAVVTALGASGLWAADPRTGFTTLFGKPVVIDDTMPEIGTGKKSVVLGDFANGYYLRLVGGIEVFVSDHRYMEYNQVGVRVTTRADGAVVDGELVQYIQHA